MWNLKNDTNEFIYKTDSDTENKLTVTKGERRGRDNLRDWDLHILYIK